MKRLLGRFFASLNKLPNIVWVTLYVSRADGSGLRPIGSQGIGADGGPKEFRWTPDGKRLTFLVKDALYSLP